MWTEPKFWSVHDKFHWGLTAIKTGLETWTTKEMWHGVKYVQYVAAANKRDSSHTWDSPWGENGFELVCVKSLSSPGDGLICRSSCGAPLTSSTGISVKDPESDAGPLCAPLLWSSGKCPRFVREGLSGLCWGSKCLVLDSSLKEPDMSVRMDSGESASSLAKDRLLHREDEEMLQIHRSVPYIL